MRLPGIHRKLIYLVILPVVVAFGALFASEFLFSEVPSLNGLVVRDMQKADSLRSPAKPSDSILVVTFDEHIGEDLGLGSTVNRTPRSVWAELFHLLDESQARAALLDVFLTGEKPDQVQDNARIRQVLNSLKTLKVTLATGIKDGSRMSAPDPVPNGPMYPITVWNNWKSDRVRIASVWAEESQVTNDLLGGYPRQLDSLSGHTLLYAPVSVVLQAFDIPSSAVITDYDRARVSAGPLEWDLNENLGIPVRWTKSDLPFTHYKLVDALKLLRDPRKRRLFSDKIVIIGYSGGPLDQHETGPFGLMYGVDFLAQMTNTIALAHEEQLRTPAEELVRLCYFGLGVLSFLAFRTQRVRYALAATAGLGGICYEAQKFLAQNYGMRLLTSVPLGVIILSALAGLLIGRYWTDRVELSPPPKSDDAAVLFLDIRGSTALLNEVGVKRYQPLLSELFRRYEKIVSASGGVIERTLGDGFIAIFRRGGSSHYALSCARCARELARATEEVGETQKIAVRVAIGFEAGRVSGDYVKEGGKKVWSSSGSTVHLAQRLQSLCGELEIAIAVGPVARRLIADEERCDLVCHSPVKGFEEEVEVSSLQL